MRAAMVALAVALVSVALAGCGTPSEGNEPDRPSVVLGDRVVDGERLDHDGAMLLSSLPEETAPLLSPDRPMNCFRIETDTGEMTYLGGAVVGLSWTASTAATAELTLTASNLPAGAWRASGPSPLQVSPVASDEQPVSLPMLVQVEATGPMELGADQEIAVHVTVGLLESLIDSLVLVQADCPA